MGHPHRSRTTIRPWYYADPIRPGYYGIGVAPGYYGIGVAPGYYADGGGLVRTAWYRTAWYGQPGTDSLVAY